MNQSWLSHVHLNCHAANQQPKLNRRAYRGIKPKMSRQSESLTGISAQRLKSGLPSSFGPFSFSHHFSRHAFTWAGVGQNCSFTIEPRWARLMGSPTHANDLAKQTRAACASSNKPAARAAADAGVRSAGGRESGICSNPK